MFDPMSFDRASVDATKVVYLALALALALVGAWLVRRVTEIEPDSHWFRATAPRRGRVRPVFLTVGVSILFVLAAGITVLTGWY